MTAKMATLAGMEMGRDGGGGSRRGAGVEGRPAL